jgi:GrpB-like predicted nucleotidyltransferase (UPF0157 family)
VPDDDALYERRLAEVTVGAPRRLDRRIELVEHDPEWARRYERERAAIRTALGARALRLEHVGSTSVAGLAAKPVVDVVLEVADAADEAAYVPALESAGYLLVIREPAWFEHRLLRPSAADVNLHVFGAGCTEVDRMIRFRDRLRTDAADRALYEATKRELAAREWTYMQQYADAKSAVVQEILARAGG